MWEIHVSDQLATFLWSIVLGIFLCFLYDIIRAMRKVGRPSNFSVLVEDIFFWIVSAFITFLFLLARTNGEIRAYVLAMAVCGFIFSRYTLSRLTLTLLTAVMRFFKYIFRCVSVAFNRFWNAFFGFLGWFGGNFQKIFKSSIKTAKKLLKSAGKLLYTVIGLRKIKNGD